VSKLARNCFRRQFCKSLLDSWDSLVIKNNILYRKWETPNLKSYILQIIIPKGRIKQILEKAHDSFLGEHFGVNKTSDRIRKHFYWATCKQNVKSWWRTCVVCVAKRDLSKKREIWIADNFGFLFKRLQIDILGPFPVSSSGN